MAEKTGEEDEGTEDIAYLRPAHLFDMSQRESAEKLAEEEEEEEEEEGEVDVAWVSGAEVVSITSGASHSGHGMDESACVCSKPFSMPLPAPSEEANVTEFLAALLGLALLLEEEEDDDEAEAEGSGLTPPLPPLDR